MVKIYLTDLAAYNEGLLSGKWVKLPKDEEELKEDLQEEVLNRGYKEAQARGICCCVEHEEFFITDYETEYNSLDIGEYTNIFNLNKKLTKLQGIIDSRNIDNKIIRLFFDYLDYEDIINRLEEGDFRVYYDIKSFGDIAYHKYEEGMFGSIGNDYLERHIDFESIGRDLKAEGNFLTDFNNRIAIEVFN